MHCDQKKIVIQITPIILIPYNNLGGDGMIHYTHWRHQQRGRLAQHMPHHVLAHPSPKTSDSFVCQPYVVCEVVLLPHHDTHKLAVMRQLCMGTAPPRG